jgi:hypothetical protein
MPLSEQEQRLLEEMERSLYHNDADYVATVSGGHGGKRNYTTIVVGILVGLLGIATIVTGVAIRLPIVGILGFVVMFVGVLLAISTPKRAGADDSQAAGDASSSTSNRASSKSKPDFMDRLNERWEKRQDDHDQ